MLQQTFYYRFYLLQRGSAKYSQKMDGVGPYVLVVFALACRRNVINGLEITRHVQAIDVKKRFFTFFNVFYFSYVF